MSGDRGSFWFMPRLRRRLAVCFFRPIALLATINFYLIAVPVLQGWQYATLISPAFVILLLTRISGVRMLEARAERAWGDDPDYRQYRDTTPMLIPMRPRR